MKELVYYALNAYEHWVIFYLAAISIIYFTLLLTGLIELMRRNLTRVDPEVMRTIESSPLIPPISILAPAFNERASICQSVRSMLALNYPEMEVVVINDGSKDDTLQVLIDEFHLYRSASYYETRIPSKQVRGVYQSMDFHGLVVVDKENGGKADSLNAGLNVARYPLVCSVDADSILEQDSLLRGVRPFVYNPDLCLASGGIIRVVNGCGVLNGRVTNVRSPQKWIARFQVIEYLRAFLGGRVGFSSFNSLLVISGAFGIFSKAAVLAIGGYRTDTVGEDMEIVVRLHRWAREQKRHYLIAFEPDPVCWTEVPESLKILRRQRNRWQRGTLETMWNHRGMILNPKYGSVGMIAFPYFVIFEVFGPLVELTGYVLTILGWIFGLFDGRMAFLFFLASISYGVLLSLGSVVLEEMTLSRYPRIVDMLIMLASSVLESLGFRQLLTVWRCEAFITLFRGKHGWGAMERKGFGTPKSPAPVEATPALASAPKGTPVAAR